MYCACHNNHVVSTPERYGLEHVTCRQSGDGHIVYIYEQQKMRAIITVISAKGSAETSRNSPEAERGAVFLLLDHGHAGSVVVSLRGPVPRCV